MSHSTILSRLNFARPFSKSAAASLIAAMFGLVVLLPAAEARDRNTVVTGPNGKSAEHNVARQAGDVSGTTTGPNGNTASRSVDRSSSGTSATVTGPKGNSATRKTTRTTSRSGSSTAQP